MKTVFFILSTVLLSFCTSDKNSPKSDFVKKVFSNSKINMKLATKLFRYSSFAMNTFPYIKKYQTLIDHWLRKKTFNSHQFQRYTLVSLFLDWRATRHQGGVFTTILSRWRSLKKRPITKLKLRVVNYFKKIPIKNDDEYLSAFNIGNILIKKEFRKLSNLYKGECLYNFVIQGLLK